jgi:hypothetical protein
MISNIKNKNDSFCSGYYAECYITDFLSIFKALLSAIFIIFLQPKIDKFIVE